MKLITFVLCALPIIAIAGILAALPLSYPDSKGMDAPPAGWRIIKHTILDEYKWEKPMKYDAGKSMFRDIWSHPTKQAAIDAAWSYYEFERPTEPKAHGGDGWIAIP